MSISRVFRFSLRLLAAFLAAKLILLLWGADTPKTLLGLSLGLTLLIYFFDFLPPSKIGWFIARQLIALNQVRAKRRGPTPPGD
jgi:hypothetical protein